MGASRVKAGSMVETVTTDVRPPIGTPAEAGITSPWTGSARVVRTTPSAGPARTVAAASPMAAAGLVSLAGGPRPAGRPVARPAPMIETIHAAPPPHPTVP